MQKAALSIVTVLVTVPQIGKQRKSTGFIKATLQTTTPSGMIKALKSRWAATKTTETSSRMKVLSFIQIISLTRR